MTNKKSLALMTKLQRVEKIKLQISTRCETSRNGAEFRILRRKMYVDTSTEQKTENAKSGLDSMSKPLFILLGRCYFSVG